MRLTQKLSTIVKAIDSVGEHVGMVTRWLIVAILGVSLFATGARYLFGRPPVWGYELQKMLWAGLVLFGGYYALRLDAHVRFDVFYRKLSLRGRAILNCFTHLFFFIFFIAIMLHAAPYGWSSFLRDEHLVSLWGPPIWPVKMLVPIAGFLFLVQGSAIYVRNLYTAITGKELI